MTFFCMNEHVGQNAEKVYNKEISSMPQLFFCNTPLYTLHVQGEHWGKVNVNVHTVTITYTFAILHIISFTGSEQGVLRQIKWQYVDNWHTFPFNNTKGKWIIVSVMIHRHGHMRWIAVVMEESNLVFVLCIIYYDVF